MAMTPAEHAAAHDDRATVITMQIIRDANARITALGSAGHLAALLVQRAHRLAAVERGGYD